MIDQYVNATEDGGYAVADCVWPGYDVVFSSNFPELARFLRNRTIPAVDLGGFVPGGAQDFDVHRGVPSQSYLDEGRAILNPSNDPSSGLLMGLDMGEQDVRYLWGYAKDSELCGPTDRVAQCVKSTVIVMDRLLHNRNSCRVDV